MADPLDLLQTAKLEKFNRKESMQINGSISAENLEKELPVLDYSFLSLDCKNFTSVNNTAENLFFGDKGGLVHIFNYKEVELGVLKPKKIISSEVTSIDIWNNTNLVTSLKSGHIMLWELKSHKLLHNSTVFATPVIKVAFGASQNQLIALTDSINVIEVKKKILKYKFIVKQIPNLEHSIVTFEILKSNSLSSNLLIISFERLLVYSFENSSVLFNISSIRPDSTPYTSWIADTNKYIVSISYSTTIAIYNVLKEGFNASLCFESAHDVCGLQWLKKDILVVISRYADACIYRFDGRKKNIVQEVRINIDIRDQILINDTLGLPCSTFHNSIAGNQKIVVLGKERIPVFTLFNWNECLSALIEKGKWLECLNLGCIFLQDLGFSFMSEIPSKVEILRKLNEILKEFTLKSKLSKNEKIALSLEFTVKYSMLDALFEHLYLVFFENESDTQVKDSFVNEIYLYVQNGIIKIINSGFLSRILEYLIAKNEIDTAENIILHLDPACLDYKILVPICDKYNLINAYIYINTQSSLQSYVNPLKKIFKLASKSTENKQKFFAYNLLWYLRLCFLGQTFPPDKIRDDLKDGNYFKIAQWIIKRKHLQTLIEIDANVTLNVIFLIFSNQSIQNSLSKQGILKEVIQKIESLLVKSNPFFAECVNFMIKVNEMISLKFSKTSAIMISKYLLEKSPLSNSESSNSQSSAFILSLLKSCKPYQPSEISDLIRITLNSRYLEILSYLYQLAGDFHEAILCYIQSDSSKNKVRVFAVIDEIFEDIPQESIPAFKEILIKNLSELAEIDTDLVGKLVTCWFQSEHSLTISKLSAAPQLQLKYLSDLLRSSSQVDPSLVLLYIRLLCEFHPGSLMGFLKSSEDFSYDECLKIVTQYRHVEGISYMHERLGSIKEAIIVIINHLNDIKYSIKKQIREGAVVKENNIEDIKYYIEGAKEICERNSPKFEDTEYDENWYYLLKNCLDLYSELDSGFDKYPLLLTILDECIKDIMNVMINFVDFDKIISKITENHGSLPFKHFRESTITVLSRFSYNQNIFAKANSLIIKDKSMLTEKLFDEYCQGICSEDFFCVKCKLEIDRTSMLNPEDSVVVFECGHTFHKNCIQIRTCEGCRQIEVRNKEFVNSLRMKKQKKKDH